MTLKVAIHLFKHFHLHRALSWALVRSFMCQNNYGKLFFPLFIYLQPSYYQRDVVMCIWNNNNNLFEQENFFLCKSNENRNECGHVAVVDGACLVWCRCRCMGFAEKSFHAYGRRNRAIFKNRHNLHLMRLRMTEMGAFGLETTVWCSRELGNDNSLFILKHLLSGGNIFIRKFSLNTERAYNYPR